MALSVKNMLGGGGKSEGINAWTKNETSKLVKIEIGYTVPTPPNSYLYNLAIVPFEDGIHYIGGPTTTYARQHFVWSPSNGWVNGTSLPVNMSSKPVGVVYNNEIHIFNTNAHYVLRDNAWVSIDNIPEVLSYMRAVVHGGKIHIFSPTSDNVHYTWDGTWSAKETLNITLDSQCRVINYNDVIHILNLSSGALYTYEDGVATQISTMPIVTNYGGADATVYGDKIVCFQVDSAEPNKYVNAVAWNGESWEVIGEKLGFWTNGNFFSIASFENVLYQTSSINVTCIPLQLMNTYDEYNLVSYVVDENPNKYPHGGYGEDGYYYMDANENSFAWTKFVEESYVQNRVDYRNLYDMGEYEVFSPYEADSYTYNDETGMFELVNPTPVAVNTETYGLSCQVKKYTIPNGTSGRYMIEPYSSSRFSNLYYGNGTNATYPLNHVICSPYSSTHYATVHSVKVNYKEVATVISGNEDTYPNGGYIGNYYYKRKYFTGYGGKITLSNAKNDIVLPVNLPSKPVYYCVMHEDSSYHSGYTSLAFNDKRLYYYSGWGVGDGTLTYTQGSCSISCYFNYAWYPETYTWFVVLDGGQL